MRIGFFTECYLPVVNGIVYSVSNFKKALESDGHEVFVFAPDSNIRLSENGFVGCRNIGHPAYPGYGLMLPFGKNQHQIIKSLDVIHVQHPFVIGRHALNVARRFDKPLVFTNHTQYGQYSHYIPVLGKTLQSTVERYVVRFVNRCDTIVAPSAGMKRYLTAKEITRPIVVVPNGIDIARFVNPGRSRPEVKEKLGLNPNADVILYSGRIALEKNLDFLLDSLCPILKKAPGKATLLVAGGGPQEEGFRRAVAKRDISDSVVMLGIRPQAEMPLIYRAADIFATASKTEVHPLTIIEAQASGLPVVAVDAMGTGDIVTHGKDGILVKEDRREFTSAVEQLLKDSETREAMSQRAKLAAERFSVERSAELLLEAYDLAARENAKRADERAAPMRA